MTEMDKDRRRQLIAAEYHEMPGLKLTARQASRFWNLGPLESEAVLDALVLDGVLLRTRDGHYVLFSGSHLA